MSVTIYPDNPVQRLVATVIPNATVADLQNPVLRKLAQIPGFGAGGCVPQAAGVKLRESLADMPVPNVMEHIAHAKRWIRENITTYIDGKLPTVIRKFKYAANVVKILRYVAQIIATLNFLVSILQKEIALANAWAAECDALIEFAEANLTPSGLRTQAERKLAKSLQVAHTAIAQQIGENTQSLQCLI